MFRWEKIVLLFPKTPIWIDELRIINLFSDFFGSKTSRCFFRLKRRRRLESSQLTTLSLSLTLMTLTSSTPIRSKSAASTTTSSSTDSKSEAARFESTIRSYRSSFSKTFWVKTRRPWRICWKRSSPDVLHTVVSPSDWTDWWINLRILSKRSVELRITFRSV